jgi:hypothetical protein
MNTSSLAEDFCQFHVSSPSLSVEETERSAAASSLAH